MPRTRKRVVRCAALFLCLACFATTGAAACPPIDGPAFRVRQAFDGDTLRLADGRKVRLAGVDTPELGHDGAPDEPYAQAAHRFMQELLEKNHWRVRLTAARERKDRYGRTLGYVAGTDGTDLQTALLERGLALTTLLPPNLSRLDCLKAAESRARRARRGLWRLLPKDPHHLKGAPRHLFVRGRVRRVGRSRKSLWIDLDGPLSLRIARSDLRRFSDIHFDRLPGREIEAQGWLHKRRRGWMMRLRHPAALKVVH